MLKNQNWRLFTTWLQVRALPEDPKGREQRQSSEKIVTNDKKKRASRGIRTPDLLITNQLLYR